MKLRERLDKVTQMDPGWEHYRAMCDIFPALLEVVEQQHRALEAIVEACAGYNEEAKFARNTARAALSLMDREES